MVKNNFLAWGGGNRNQRTTHDYIYRNAIPGVSSRCGKLTTANIAPTGTSNPGKPLRGSSGRLLRGGTSFCCALIGDSQVEAIDVFTR